MEVLSLTWDQVNFKERFIQVVSEKSKSGKGRKIPMNDVVCEELRKLKKDHDYIFYNKKTGSHIRHVKTAFWRACKKAGIKPDQDGNKLRVHDLRHTAASMLVNDCGIDIVTASKILEHSDIKTTMGYIHPT